MGFNGFLRRLGNQICAARAKRITANLMKTRTSCLLLTTLLLAGCWQKSMNPFYTAKDLVSEPKLAGTWKEPKDPNNSSDVNPVTWAFTDAGSQRFDLVIRDKEETHEYDARVFQLDGNRFLDIVSQSRAISTMPAHHLFRVAELDAELKLAPLNMDWMHKWLRQHPGSLAHIAVVDPEHRDNRDKDELVLTADTKALQKFVHEHMNDKDFFADATVLKK
jgi:hypothetical protein